MKKLFIFFTLILLLCSCYPSRYQTIFNLGVDYAVDKLQEKHQGGMLKIQLNKSSVKEYSTPLNFIHYQLIVLRDSLGKDTLVIPYRINYPVIKDSIKKFGEKHFFNKQTSLNMLENQKWAIDINHSAIARLAKTKLQEGTFAMSDFEDIEQKEKEIIKDENKYIASFFIRDILTKYGGQCTYGMQEIAFQVAECDKDENVKGILFILDSPGGTVKGTEELAEIIAQCEKPTLAYVDGNALSAAYWIASQTDMIITNSLEDCYVGSIGVYAMHFNYAEHLKNEGVKVTFIQAGEDKTKGNNYEDIDENWLTEKQKDVDETYAKFKQVINRKRSITQEAMTGKSYKKEKALGLGLIDKIGTFEDAMNEIDFMYRKKKLLNT